MDHVCFIEKHKSHHLIKLFRTDIIVKFPTVFQRFYNKLGPIWTKQQHQQNQMLMLWTYYLHVFFNLTHSLNVIAQ